MKACTFCGKPTPKTHCSNSCRCKAWYRDNGARHRARLSADYSKNPAPKLARMRSPKGRYIAQRSKAKLRGIEWLFTLETWVDLWGDDLDMRGSHIGDLCMARKRDEGPYSQDNCYKATVTENHREGNIKRWSHAY